MKEITDFVCDLWFLLHSRMGTSTMAMKMLQQQECASGTGRAQSLNDRKICFNKMDLQYYNYYKSRYWNRIT